MIFLNYLIVVDSQVNCRMRAILGKPVDFNYLFYSKLFFIDTGNTYTFISP